MIISETRLRKDIYGAGLIIGLGFKFNNFETMGKGFSINLGCCSVREFEPDFLGVIL